MMQMSIAKTNCQFWQTFAEQKGTDFLYQKKHKEDSYLTVYYLLMLALNTQEAQGQQPGRLCNLATARSVMKLMNVKVDKKITTSFLDTLVIA